MKFIILLLLLNQSVALFYQDFPTEISAQYGPETGLSLFFPKLAYRPPHEGAYLGAFISVFIVSIATVSVGVAGGYRHKGLAAETSLAFTVVGGSRDGAKSPTTFQATINPKVMLGHRVFVGFGPGIYLYKSKKDSNSLWDDVGRFNFEVGYSENLRF